MIRFADAVGRQIHVAGTVGCSWIIASAPGPRKFQKRFNSVILVNPDNGNQHKENWSRVQWWIEHGTVTLES